MTAPDTPDLDELLAIARAATEIPNGCCHAEADVHHGHFLHSYLDGSASRTPWGAFIAAANPSTVEALIERVRAAEQTGERRAADAFQEWAAKNEIAEVIDWKWFGEICRRYATTYGDGSDE